jgi:biopolymer transport protein ExbD
MDWKSASPRQLSGTSHGDNLRIPHAFRGRTGPDNSSMTPMIDVVFLLLIFFICASARQLREALLPANLPAGALETAQATTAPVQVDEAYIKLKQTAAGTTIAEINGTDYASLDLLEGQIRALAEIDAEVPVILDVAAGVPFGEVIRVYDLCQRVKFKTIKFAIDLKQPAEPSPK